MSRSDPEGVPFFQVDAFAERPFEGNPAAVCVLTEALDERTMQCIAAEQNLSETAFVVRADAGPHELRWFTPSCEIDLAGHPTLATGWVLIERYGEEVARFTTKSGPLEVRRSADGRLELDLPSHPPRSSESPLEDAALCDALGLAAGTSVFAHGENRLLLVRDERAVRAVAPDFEALRAAAPHLAIVTAPGTERDFVSRVFAPAIGVDEDPVTGSAHSVLSPFWSERLGKARLRARQLSSRGGELECESHAERVTLHGAATLVIEGTIYPG